MIRARTAAGLLTVLAPTGVAADVITIRQLKCVVAIPGGALGTDPMGNKIITIASTGGKMSMLCDGAELRITGADATIRADGCAAILVTGKRNSITAYATTGAGTITVQGEDNILFYGPKAAGSGAKTIGGVRNSMIYSGTIANITDCPRYSR